MKRRSTAAATGPAPPRFDFGYEIAARTLRYDRLGRYTLGRGCGCSTKAETIRGALCPRD